MLCLSGRGGAWPATLLSAKNESMGREVWALSTASSLAHAQVVVGHGGQEPALTDRGFLLSLPRLPAPHALETAPLSLLSLGGLEGGRFSFAVKNKSFCCCHWHQMFVSSFSELLLLFLQGNPFFILPQPLGIIWNLWVK